MGKFKKGDRIIVRQDSRWTDQWGWVGTVKSWGEDSVSCHMDVEENMGPDRFYQEDQIDLFVQMPELEFSLDEIHQAQEIMVVQRD